MLEDLSRKVIDRLGRRGAIAVGVLLSVAFLMFGGPLLLATASSTVVGIVAFAAILVGPALWVLADARKRGVQRAFLWALFALLGNVIGAVVYVLVRDQRPTQRPCGACGRPVQSSHAGCPYCGSLQASAKRSCAQCRNELELDWRFCPYCRSEVGRASPAT